MSTEATTRMIIGTDIDHIAGPDPFTQQLLINKNLFFNYTLQYNFVLLRSINESNVHFKKTF